MDVTKLTSASLKKIAALLAQREKLISQIEEIDCEISALQTENKESSQKIKSLKKSKVTTGKRSKRGAVKELIITELKTAGSKGITVADLSKKLNRDGKSLHAWFHNIGKKITNIKRIDRGLFRWE